MIGMLKAGARLALAAFVLALALPAGAAPVKLKFSFFTNEQEMTYVTAIKPFIDAVNRDARGVVEIDFYPNGALGRSLVQQSQMVLDGVADMAFIIPATTPGRFPDNGVVELPGMFRDIRESTLAFTRLVASGKLHGYEDYFVIGAFGTSPYSVHARRPLKSLDDFKGMKIGTTNPTGAATLKALGAVPVPMVVNEIPEAIGRGTIDGTLLFVGAMMDFGVNRVTSYDYFARLGVQPLTVLMNRKKFESLPKAGQDAIRKYSGEWFAARYNEGYGAYVDKITAQLKADPKRTVTFPPQAELDAARARYKPVYDDWLARSPRNAELLKAAEAELAKLR